MKHMKHGMLYVAALVCMALILCLGSAALADGVTYVDANGQTQTCASYNLLTADTTELNGWYVVDSNVTNNHRLEVNGEAHLILVGNCNLTVPKGIKVSRDNSLTIYGQSGNTGKLLINDVDGAYAGIGGSEGSSGTITINGGTVTANGGGFGGAGIGGGYDGNGKVIINGGIVTAVGGYNDYGGGAGIGGGAGNGGSGSGTVTITGGTVTATGGGRGSGIGGGSNGSGTVFISGGTITATGGSNGAGIGGRYEDTEITLGCANASDSIYASNYEGTVNVAEGKYLKDSASGQYYTGEDIDTTAIAGKTLVKATQRYAVTVNTTGSGTVTPSATLAEADTAITLTVQPNAGYALMESNLSVTYTDGENQPRTITPVQGSGSDANKWTFQMPAYPVTVNATFVAQTYSITYELNADDLEALSAGGYVVTASFSAPDEVESISCNEYWMKWDGNQYTATMNDAPETLFFTVTCVYRDYPDPEDPDYCDESYRDFTSDESPAPGNGSITVTDTWGQESFTLNYTYSYVPGVPMSFTVNDLPVTLPVTTRPYHTFGGWYDNSDLAGDPVTAIPAGTTENVILYAAWTPEEHTITFDTKGGSIVEPITQGYGTAVTAPANPIRDGYTFVGWSQEIPASMPAEDMTINAIWDPVNYPITYDLRGGSLDGLTNPASYNIETPTFTLFNPVQEDAVFAGWTGSNGDMPETVVTISKGSTGSRSYTAQWSKDFTTCKATVPNPIWQGEYYYIGWLFEFEDHGGIVVKDSQGNTLVYGTDYYYSGTESLDYPDKYTDDLCTHVGENCRVTLEGCGDWIGTLTADIVISPPSHVGDGWKFEAGVLSISDASAMTPKDSFNSYPWYEYSKYSTAIVIGDGITSVPYMAFGGNSNVNPYANVKKVTLPASMKTIGESAFAYMTALTSIDLKNVTDIGINAFNQCVSLEVNVPGTVTSIGGGAFGACKRVAYAVNVSDIKNGTVSADVNYAEAQTTVTLTVKPDEGYTLDTLNVTTANGEPVTVENGAFTMPDSSVIVSAVFITPWQSLQNMLNEGGTVTLDKNYTALANDTALEVPAGVTVTLDLNGHTLDRGLAGSQDVYDRALIVKGNLTVTDSGTGGTITGGNDSGVYVDENGALTLSGGSITGNDANLGGGVRNYGTLTLNGGAISGNTADYGGGVRNVGTLTLNSGAMISGNTSYDVGGVCNPGTIIMNGGTISDNTATGRDSIGGGVEIEQGTMTMNGGTISGNTAGNGGGVSVQNAGTFEMTGGEISGNKATNNYGGGVYNFGTITLSGGAISGNTSNNLGGGIFSWSGTLNLSGSPTVTGNVHGGTITNGTLSGGTADNLFIGDSHITVTGAMTSDTPIGVSLGKWNGETFDRIPGVFTSGLSGKGTAANFTSDSDAYAVRLDEGGEAKLTPWHGIAVSAENGSVTATVNENTVTQAAEGDIVTLAVTPAEDYTIGTVSYNDGTNHTITPMEGIYSFTMPDSDVTVTAVFYPVFGDPDFVMPTALTTIEESAFEGDTEISIIDAHSVTTIGKWAFKDCTGLTQIKLSQNCAIDEYAFSGCGTVYVYAPAGGSTQEYCGKTTNPCVFVEKKETDDTLSSLTGQEGPVYQFPSGSTLPSILP